MIPRKVYSSFEIPECDFLWRSIIDEHQELSHSPLKRHPANEGRLDSRQQQGRRVEHAAGTRLGREGQEWLAAAQDAINSNFRAAKVGYFYSNFSPLLVALADDKHKSGSGGKCVAKRGSLGILTFWRRRRGDTSLRGYSRMTSSVRLGYSKMRFKLVVPGFTREGGAQ